MANEIRSGDIFPLENFDKHIKINAGPGAGKTHFLVENVKNLILTHPKIMKSRLRKIVCITYTNAAVEEIKHRLSKFSDSVEAYTIHGFIIEHIIKPFQQDLRDIIYDTFAISVPEKGKITSQIEGLGILHGEDKDKIYKFVTDCVNEQSVLSYSKKTMGEIEIDNNLYLSSGEIKLKASSSVLEKHKLPIKEYVWSAVKKLTHNEILFFGYEILKQNPTALYAIRVKFPFIFVDEFQDTNPLQTMLIKMIGQKSTVIGIIGDVAQSIYSFQGAKPKQFSDFSIDGERELVEYEIKGNRRSIGSVVNFCNYLRSSDVLVQNSIRSYECEEDKNKAEAKPVCFLIGNSVNVKQEVRRALDDGGVVLTRAWASAFSYIQDISEPQNALLRNIYNSYFNSPIDIRAEITEINNVTWVRAFKFIFLLWDAFKTGSFIDAVQAISLYSKFDKKKMLPKVVFQIKKISESIFENLKDTDTAISKLGELNKLLKEERFNDLRETVFGTEFTIVAFSEFDKDALVSAVSGLDWKTAYKLFNEVFTADSKYMTVHQAKGREWNRVVVSASPSSRNDKTTLEAMYQSPKILDEKPEEEFTRIYYVACSRAIEELYIHFPDGFDKIKLKSLLDTYTAKTNQVLQYTIVE